MSEIDDDLADLLGPDPEAEPETEALVDEVPPKSRPMGAASRELVKRSRTYPVNQAAKKNTPERLQRLLDYAAEMPVGSDAASRAGISYSTLKYWLQKSLEGIPGDGFDMLLGIEDETGEGEESNSIRFHNAWDAAMETGVGQVERATITRAGGYWEPLTYQGRVIYKIKPDAYDIANLLGEEVDDRNPANWLRDKYGAPIPESVWKMDPDLAQFILKTRKPLVYGNKATLDVNVKGGVLVVGMQMSKPEDLNVLENQYRTLGLPDVIFEEDEASTIDNTGDGVEK